MCCIMSTLSICADEFKAYRILANSHVISIPNLNDGYCGLKSFVHLINNNPIGYYDFERTYSTPLKLKKFTASSEFTESILPEFEALRDSVMNATYYYVYNTGGSRYNLQSKNFKFEFTTHGSIDPSLRGYIDIGGYINLSCPSLKPGQGRSYDKFTWYLTSPKVSEEIAAEIEDGKYQIAFLFKFGKVKTAKRDAFGGRYTGGPVYIVNYIICKTSKIYLFDSTTDDIIADWSSLLTVAPSKPSTKTTTNTKK